MLQLLQIQYSISVTLATTDFLPANKIRLDTFYVILFSEKRITNTSLRSIGTLKKFFDKVTVTFFFSKLFIRLYAHITNRKQFPAFNTSKCDVSI